MAGTTRAQFVDRALTVRDTHRGLWYEDGVLVRVLEAGRYERPRRPFFSRKRLPDVDVLIVDVRERDLTIKGQEILTADKVAVRASIVVRFQVIDPKAALQRVEDYEDRLYTDAQLAARHSLASMTLEEILTNRNRLSEDILSDVKGTAATYGVDILRADIKDIVFPGNVQETMNRVLTAERLSQAQLIEARTKAQVSRIDAEAKANERRIAAQSEADAQRVKVEAEARALTNREESARMYDQHPSLLRLQEIEMLRDVARFGGTRWAIDFGSKQPKPSDEPAE